MSYFNRTIISNVHISHPTIELAHYAWIITKALIIAETAVYFFTHPQKLFALFLALTLLYIIYKVNEIK